MKSEEKLLRGGIKNNRDFVDGKIFQTVNFGFAPLQMSGLRGVPGNTAVYKIIADKFSDV